MVIMIDIISHDIAHLKPEQPISSIIKLLHTEETQD